MMARSSSSSSSMSRCLGGSSRGPEGCGLGLVCGVRWTTLEARLSLLMERARLTLSPPLGSVSRCGGGGGQRVLAETQAAAWERGHGTRHASEEHRVTGLLLQTGRMNSSLLGKEARSLSSISSPDLWPPATPWPAKGSQLLGSINTSPYVSALGIGRDVLKTIKNSGKKSIT